MPDTYMVVGGAGFVGSFLVDELLSSGNHVVSFDVRTDHPLYGALDIRGDVVTERGDITQLPELLDAMQRHDPDYVVHLAATLSGLEAAPWRAIDVNCAGTNNVFAAARERSVERVVWASSTSVYADAARYPGAPRPVVDEDALVGPRSLYGACKVFDEVLADAYRAHHGLDVVGVRPPGIYGPCKSIAEVHNDMIEAAVAGESMKIPCGGQAVELVYVRDVARAFRLAAEAENPSQSCYNIGADYLTYRDAAETITEVLGGDFTVTDDETTWWTHDIDWDAARDELTYSPAYSFADGIAERASILRRATE